MRKLLSTLIFFASLLAPGLSFGENVSKYLILIIDVSSSVSPEEFALQKIAYIKILRDPEIQRRLDNTWIAIIEFSSDASIIIPWTQDYDTAANLYEKVPRSKESGTDPAIAITLAIQMMNEVSGVKTIDISGDGPPGYIYGNGGWRGQMPDYDKPYRERMSEKQIKNAMTTQGITLNALIFGDEGEMNNAYWWYEAAVVNGFIMKAAHIDAFFTALRAKLLLEIV